MKIIIVGAVAGGASAAARLRRNDESAEIIMLDKGKYVSYANCGLPYYLGGALKDKNRLFVASKEMITSRFNIDIRTQNEVIAVDTQAHTVTIRDLANDKTYDEKYDKLILSPGASPRFPATYRCKGVFTLRTIDDCFNIDDYINNHNVKHATIVGAGFIGIEMAENLRHRGLDVKICELSNQILPPLDPEMAQYIADDLTNHGVELCISTKIETIEHINDGKINVLTSKNTSFETGIVIMSIGVVPDTKFLENTDVKRNAVGGIIVDDHFQTSAPDIYAIGDAIEIKSHLNAQPMMIPLAGPANRQGRALADLLTGLKPNPIHVMGSSVVSAFDLNAAMVGWNEKQLKKAGINYRKVYAHPNNHASCHPGVHQLHFKLLYNEEGKILGAQGVGHDGIAKRIDVLATAMRLGGSVFDLEELELCYAPPFSSPKDPVNLLGFIASNNLRNRHDLVTCEEIDALDASEQLVDVRTAGECKHGMIPNALHIPVDELRQRLDELDKRKTVYIYCRVGQRGYIACRILQQNGFIAKNLSGGWLTYEAYRNANKN